jgi:hypothetical protein
MLVTQAVNALGYFIIAPFFHLKGGLLKSIPDDRLLKKMRLTF